MKYRQANETRKRRGERCRKETLPNDCLNILLTFVVMGDGDGGGPTLYLLLLPFSVLPQLLTKFSYYRLVVDLITSH